MPEETKYQLFVSNHCTSCSKIQAFLNENNISFFATNIDEDEFSLPFSLMIIPALIKDNKLIAYGVDIIRYFENKKGSVQ